MTDTEAKIRRLLADVYTPEGVDIWMGSANWNLNNATPLQFLAAGDGDRVLAEVERLSDGNG